MTGAAVTSPPVAEGATLPPGSRAGGRRSGGRQAVAPGTPGWADRWYLREVIVAWLAARIVVGAALALTHFVADTVAGENGGSLDTTDLLGWDAGWYLSITENGYAAVGEESRRFFPLLPLMVRTVTALPGLGGQAGAVLLGLVNLIALGFALALVGVARVEGLDDDAIRRLVWFAALAPPAFVLVMGYAEALAGLLAVAVFIGARTRRWELAIIAGLLGGLCRPLGLLLAVPVAVEAVRGLRLPLARRLEPAPPPGSRAAARRTSRGEITRRVAAVAAPLVGAGLYLGWSAGRYEDGLAPLTMQRDAARHGSTGNPLDVLSDALRGATEGEIGTALHVPWLLLAVAGLVVMVRWLPISYTAWSALVLAAVMTGSNLDSSERYL